jgi:hypothetical protein
MVKLQLPAAAAFSHVLPTTLTRGMLLHESRTAAGESGICGLSSPAGRRQRMGESGGGDLAAIDDQAAGFAQHCGPHRTVCPEHPADAVDRMPERVVILVRSTPC